LLYRTKSIGENRLFREHYRKLLDRRDQPLFWHIGALLSGQKLNKFNWLPSMTVRGAKVWADFEDLAIITSHDIETVAGFRHFCI
jgi:hypothetical protein